MKTDALALAAIAASALLGHALITPLARQARRALVTPPPWVASEDFMVEARPVLDPAPPPPAIGPFEASSMEGRDIWQGRFIGRVVLGADGLAVHLARAHLRLLPEAPRGVVRGLRLDLAEPTPDGSWRIAAEGVPVEVGRLFHPGEEVVLSGVRLGLPGVEPAALRGRWLVATMLVDSPGGHGPLAHAHMPAGIAERIAERAARMEESRPERRNF